MTQNGIETPIMDIGDVLHVDESERVDVDPEYYDPDHSAVIIGGGDDYVDDMEAGEEYDVDDDTFDDYDAEAGN